MGDQNPKSERKRGSRYCDANICEEKMQSVKNIISKWNSISLVKRIICGLIVGIILGLVVPQASAISILGDLFETYLFISLQANGWTFQAVWVRSSASMAS